MEKIILQPKENYNPNKLSGEMYAAGIECWISIGEQEYTLEYQNATAEQVQAVLDAHDPTPEPEPLTDLQQTQLAVAEAVEKTGSRQNRITACLGRIYRIHNGRR